MNELGIRRDLERQKARILSNIRILTIKTKA